MDFLLSQNNLILLAIAILSGAMLLFPALTRRGAQLLSPTQAVQLMNRDRARLIDIRSAERFKQQHITQSRNIPAPNISEQTANWAKDTPIILVCDTGRSTAAPAAQLRKAGFTAVYSLEGGINAWIQAGLPTKKD